MLPFQPQLQLPRSEVDRASAGVGQRVELFDVVHDFSHRGSFEIDVAGNFRDDVEFSERRVGLGKFLLQGEVWEEEVIDAAILFKGGAVEEFVEEVLVAFLLHFEFQVVVLLVQAAHSC